MKRIAITAGALVLVFGVGGRAAASGQTTAGTVLVATPDPIGCDVADNIERNLESRYGVSLQGVFTYRLTVEAQTIGTHFALRPANAPADVDIVFSDGVMVLARFSTRDLAGESGVVPANARRARVCLVTGAASTFTYKAGMGVHS